MNEYSLFVKILRRLIIVIAIFTPLYGVFASDSTPQTWESTGIVNSKNDTSSKDSTKQKDKVKLKTNSWIISSGSVNNSKATKHDIKDDTGSDDDDTGSIDKDKVQQEISSYILEAYKIQWNKILKDIDVSLQKINPETDVRIQSYDRIEATLNYRKEKILDNTELSDSNRDIIINYLNYMIQSIEKRKNELEDTK
jgi:hypothetical protein